MDKSSILIDYDDDDIIIGPVTKREIVFRLKLRNLLKPKLLEPLNKYKMTDALDQDLLKYYSDILEKESYTESEVDESLLELSELSKNMSVSQENSSGDVSKNVINVSEDKENDNINNDCSLNDTLEEMEMLLKFGTKYMEPDAKLDAFKEKTEIKTDAEIPDLVNNSYLESDKSSNDEMLVKETPLNVEKELEAVKKTEDLKQESVFSERKKETESKCFLSVKRKVPQSPKVCNTKLEKPKPFESKNNAKFNKPKPICETSEPVKYNKENITRLKTTSPAVKLTKSSEKFKIPPKPFVAKAKSPHVKNVLSPVALYIKNSPTVPLIRNIFPKPETVLPTRSYQPAARKMLLSHESEPSLPANVKKYMKGPVSPAVIKHVKRINDENNTIPIETDVSGLSESSDLENAKDEISVIISKNAVRTNTLKSDHS